MRTFNSLFLTVFLLSFPSLGQSSEIVAYYPPTAYVTNRLLSFLVPGDETINSVVLNGNSECIAFVDHFYLQVFHIYCYKPGVVSAEVFLVDKDKKRRKLSLSSVQVLRESAPFLSPNSYGDIK